MATMMDSVREDAPLAELDASFQSSASSITCSLMSPQSSISQASWDRSSCSFSLSQSLSLSLSSASLLTTEEKQLNSKRWTSRGGEGDSALLSPQSLVNKPPQRQSSLYSSFGKISNSAFESLGNLTAETADTSNQGSGELEQQIVLSKPGGRTQENEQHQQQQWEIDGHNNNKDCIPIMPMRRQYSGQIDEPLIDDDSPHSTADSKSHSQGKDGNTIRIADSSPSSIVKELSTLPKTADDLEMPFNQSASTVMPSLAPSWGSSSTPSLFGDDSEIASSSISQNMRGGTPQRNNVGKYIDQCGPKTNEMVGNSDKTPPPPPPPSHSLLMESPSTHSIKSIDSCAATTSPMYVVGRKAANQKEPVQQQQQQPQRYIPQKTRFLRKHKSDQSRRRRSLVDGTLTSIVEDVDENSDEFLMMSKLSSHSKRSD